MARPLTCKLVGQMSEDQLLTTKALSELSAQVGSANGLDLQLIRSLNLSVVPNTKRLECCFDQLMEDGMS